MGIFDVNDRGLAQAATRRLGMSSPLGLQLTGDLNLSMDPANYREMQWHLGWRRWCMGFFTNTAAALQIIRMQLRNPDPPNRLIVVVERVDFQATTAGDEWQVGTVGIGPGIADLSTIITGASPMDGLNVPPGSPSRGGLIVSTQSQAQTLIRGTAVQLHEFLPSVSGSVGSGDTQIAHMNNLPVVLRPGNALFWEDNSQQTSYLVNIAWSERMANDQEQAP